MALLHQSCLVVIKGLKKLKTRKYDFLQISAKYYMLLPNQELSVLYGGPTLNYGEQLSLYVPHKLRVSMTGDLAHLQLSDLQEETRPIYRTSDLQRERMLICRT